MHTSGDTIRFERLKKLQLLRDAGMDPYPAVSKRDISIKEFIENFERNEKGDEMKTIAGRLMSLRGQGGILFADIFDGTAKGQLVLQKEDVVAASFELFEKAVDIGDFIEAKVTAYKTKRGVQSMKIASWKMLAKSLMPIPSEWYGVKDEETKLRQRYLDILLNEDVRHMFERRAKFWQSIRDFLLARGFIEFETPVIELTPGGADARPFETHHRALGIDAYLRISLELWLKRLLIAGYPNVFEIGRIFRNEGQSREHVQDYTQIETYEAYSDMRKGMEFTKDLFRHIAKEVYGKHTFEIGEHTVDLAEEWPEIDFCEEIQKRFGIDPTACSEKEAIRAVRDAMIEVGEELNKARAVDHLWKSLRKTISGPAFLVNIPAYLEPLAKRSKDNPSIVDRVQVILAGSEMSKGFSELNDPLDQRARFEEQQKMREKGDEEAQRLDEEYIKAMEYGMPPAFGFGVSERLFAFLENKPAHEAQLFPLLRPRHE